MSTTQASPQGSPLPRIPLKLEVEYRMSYGRSAETGELKNISLTGAFLEHTKETADEATTNFSSSEKLSITFKVGGRVRKINASIVWVNEFGVGLKFLPSNNRDVQIVDDLMYFVESKRESRRNVLDDIFKQAA